MPHPQFNRLNLLPLDVLILILTHLALVCRKLPLHLDGFSSIRLVRKRICEIATPLVFRRVNLVSPRLCRKLHSTPTEVSDIFKKIGRLVRDVKVRPSDLSSEPEIDAALMAALAEMPNLRALTIIYNPIDTTRHALFLAVLPQLRQLCHITLVEPPRCEWAHGWIRLGYYQPITQAEDVGAEAVDSGTDTETESGSERGPDTDTEAEIRTVRQLGTTKDLDSFRKSCLTTILQHHAPRLLSVRLQGSIPLDELSYCLLRDKACNLQLLQLIGVFQSCSSQLVAAFKQDIPWACAGKLRGLSIKGSSLSGISEDDVVCQFRLGVFGDALDEPPSVDFGLDGRRTSEQ